MFKSIKSKKLLVIIAFLGASVVYRVILKLIDQFLCWLFRMRVLNPFDEYFLYDDDLSPSNCLVCLSFQKFDFKFMKEYIKQEYFHNIPQNKVRLVQLFGRYYW